MDLSANNSEDGKKVSIEGMVFLRPQLVELSLTVLQLARL